MLIEILYGLYYGGIDLSKYQKQDFEFLLLQVLAEKCSVKNILEKWPVEKARALITFLFRLPREGTFKMIKEFPSQYQTQILAYKRNVAGSDDAQAIYNACNEFIPLFFSKLSDVLATAAGSDPAVQAQYEKIKLEFDRYLQKKYSVEDFRKFLQLFGSYAYPYIFLENYNENSSLLEKITSMSSLIRGLQGLSRPLSALQLTEMQSMLSFVIVIINHLDAYIHNPLYFKEGLELFTCTVATYQKELVNEAALPSIVEGYKAVKQFLKKSAVLQSTSKTIP